MSAFDFYQGIVVILVTLTIMAVLLFLTRRPAWDLPELVLLATFAICYILDTLWWWHGWHFSFTDHYFIIDDHRYQLTIFFILSGLFFLALIVKRWHKQN